MSGFLLVAGDWAARLGDDHFSQRLSRSIAWRGSHWSRSSDDMSIATLSVWNDWENQIGVCDISCKVGAIRVSSDAHLCYARSIDQKIGDGLVSTDRTSGATIIARAYEKFGS